MPIVQQSNSWSSRLPLLPVVVLTFVAGCSGTPSDQPDLGDVRGTITLDGKPLDRAQVIFEPENGMRSSHGYTDSEGKYRLTYIRTTPGAVLGKHTVSISTKAMIEQEWDGDGEEPLPTYTKERVPKQYRDDKPIVEVESGRNTHDFDLVSKPAG